MTPIQMIREYERTNRKLESKFMPSIKKAIHAKVLVVIHKLQNEGINQAMNYLHTDISNPKMANAVSTLYQSVGMLYARKNYSRMLNETGRKGHISGMITKGFGFSSEWNKFILDYFKRYLIEKITFEVAHTTRDAVLKVLSAANTQGWGMDKTVDKLKDWPYERFQAARIVRTEVNRAANVGAKANSELLPYLQQKEWLSAEDHRVRGNAPADHANHVGLNGTKIDAEDHFVDSINGDRLDIPGDITASAASTINCRCHVLYTAKRDRNGDLMPKRRTTTVIYPSRRPVREPILI